MEFLIVCPLVFLAGFVDAIAGGGGLISLPAYLIAGIPAHMALGTNKFSASLGTIVATYRYGKMGYIPYKMALFVAIFGLLGSLLGARMTLFFSDQIFKIIMLIILPITAIYVLNSQALKRQHNAYGIKKTLLLSIPIAFVIGLYDGFYGPGTGTFLILLLTGVVHIALREAQGMTKVINLTTNLAALSVFFYHDKVLLELGLVAGVFSILGNYIGTKFFAQKGFKAAKPIIVVVLCICYIKILSEMFGLSIGG